MILIINSLLGSLKLRKILIWRFFCFYLVVIRLCCSLQRCKQLKVMTSNGWGSKWSWSSFSAWRTRIIFTVSSEIFKSFQKFHFLTSHQFSHSAIISKIPRSWITWNICSTGRNPSSPSSSSIRCACTSSTSCRAKSSGGRLWRRRAASSLTTRRFSFGNITREGERKRSSSSTSCTTRRGIRQMLNRTKTGRLRKWVELNSGNFNKNLFCQTWKVVGVVFDGWESKTKLRKKFRRLKKRNFRKI